MAARYNAAVAVAHRRLSRRSGRAHLYISGLLSPVCAGAQLVGPEEDEKLA